MTPLQERVVLVLSSAGRMPLTLSAIAARLQERWPAEHGYHEPTVEAALNVLALAGAVTRTQAGRWSKRIERQAEAPADAPAIESPERPAEVPAAAKPTEETVDMAKNECAKHPHAGVNASGICKGCKKESNDAYRAKLAKKSTARAPKKAAPPPMPPTPMLTTNHMHKRGRKKNGSAAAPIALHDRMVMMSFAIRIKDAAGRIHDLFLTGDTVKRLAHELQEYL